MNNYYSVYFIREHYNYNCNISASSLFRLQSKYYFFNYRNFSSIKVPDSAQLFDFCAISQSHSPLYTYII